MLLAALPQALHLPFGPTERSGLQPLQAATHLVNSGRAITRLRFLPRSLIWKMSFQLHPAAPTPSRSGRMVQSGVGVRTITGRLEAQFHFRLIVAIFQFRFLD